jgi:lysine/ornithine N-monooxygenase
MSEMDPRLRTRLMNLAAEARDALPRYEYEARLIWCHAHHDDNLRYTRDGDDLVATWGGGVLVRLDSATLRAMACEDELALGAVDAPTVPDSPAELLGGTGGVS